MNNPHLKIFLKDHCLCIGKVEDENSEMKLIIDIDVEELMALDPQDAAHRVGGTVLNVLRLWHEKTFGEWQVPPVFDPPSR